MRRRSACALLMPEVELQKAVAGRGIYEGI